jgi:alpha-L-arabinofuranosidase
VVHTWTQGPAYTSKAHGQIDYLDICATRDQQGSVSIGVVNRHKDRPLPASFEMAGAGPKPNGRIFTLNGPSPEAMNSFERPDLVGISSRDHRGFGARFTLEFPAHSVSLLALSL